MPYNTVAKLKAWRKRYAKTKRCKLSSRKSQLKRKYGLTLEAYDTLLKQQRGVCAICGNPPVCNKLAADHNHKTGKVRGLLCIRCNILIGHVENDPYLISNIIEYLQKDLTF